MKNISLLDLNLFVVFQAVMEARSATLAARRLNLTQSAVSNALARLREALGDPLFVRSGRGLAPTPMATAMAPSISRALFQFESLLQLGRRFDPSLCTRHFTLSCTDDQEVSDLPRVLERFTEALPLATLEVVPVDRLLAEGGVSKADVDLFLLPMEVRAPGLHLQPLYQEKVIFAVRRDHPVIHGTTLSRRQFEALRHIEVHVMKGGGTGSLALERTLKAQGLSRSLSLVLPHFLSAAHAAAASDGVARLPLRFARALGDLLPLKILRPPFPSPTYDVGLGWHERTHLDPALSHLRTLVIEALREPR